MTTLLDVSLLRQDCVNSVTVIESEEQCRVHSPGQSPSSLLTSVEPQTLFVDRDVDRSVDRFVPRRDPRFRSSVLFTQSTFRLLILTFVTTSNRDPSLPLSSGLPTCGLPQTYSPLPAPLRFSSPVFTQSRLSGVSPVLLRHAYPGSGGRETMGLRRVP